MFWLFDILGSKRDFTNHLTTILMYSINNFMKPLTPRQQTVLSFVEEFFQQQGYPPTVREVAAHFGIQPRAADDHLSALKRKGYLHREPGLSRGLALTGRQSELVVEVPILGQIAAGQPLLATEQVEDTLPLPRSWVQGRGSLSPAGYRRQHDAADPARRPGDGAGAAPGGPG